MGVQKVLVTDDDEALRKRKGGGGTRFLLDLDLSRLGPLQLDGMFKKESRSFDMMVRTTAPLPETMRTDLAGLFAFGDRLEAEVRGGRAGTGGLLRFGGVLHGEFPIYRSMVAYRARACGVPDPPNDALRSHT